MKRFVRSAFLIATALFFSLSLFAQASNWSDPSTWGGSLPVAGEDVVIPMGQTVILDMNPPQLGSITVQGNLVFADQNINLKLGWMLIQGSGRFMIGSETVPYAHKAIITLTGGDYDATGMGLGNKFIMAMGGGTVELHGHSRDAVSWTQIVSHVYPGDKKITLADSVNWRPGDKIVIAPSGTDAEQAEKVTVTNVSANGRVVKVTPPFNFEHYGQIENIGGRDVDMRAEVGLLTRDIVIQGDPGSETDQFGGHVMIMMGSQARVEGVEFYRMGQYGRAGRYPMHWHFSGASGSEYAKNNSVHHSYHRAFVTHESTGIHVENNVAYDAYSHMYVPAEDGTEMGNVYIGNLGILCKMIPDMDDFAFPDPMISAASSQEERHPGVFWLTNPANVMIGNHAAGAVDGMGFFFDGIGTATIDDVPQDFFKDNVAHSCSSSEGGWDRAYYRTKGWGLFVDIEGFDSGRYVFKHFLAYKNTLGGAWLEHPSAVLRNAVLADNGSGANIFRSTLARSIIIGTTPNTIEPSSKDHGGINIFSNMPGHKEPKIKDVIIMNVDIGFKIEHEDIDVRSFSRDITLAGVPTPILLEEDGIRGGFVDESGDYSLEPKTLYLGKLHPMIDDECTFDGARNAWVCPLEDYAHVTVTNDFSDDELGEIKFTRQSTGENSTLFTSEQWSHWEDGYDHKANDYLPVGERYDMEFKEGMDMNDFTISVRCDRGEGVLINLLFPNGYEPRVYHEDGSMMSGLSALSDVTSGIDGYYFDETNGIVSISMNVLPGDPTGYKAFKVVKVPLRAGAEESAEAATIFPNPFSDQFLLGFKLADEEDVYLRVMDAAGRMVIERDLSSLPAGYHQFQIDARDLESGMYIYELNIGDKFRTGSITKFDE